MAVTSKEVVAKFSYNKSDGTVTKGSKSLTGCVTSIIATDVATKLKAYSQIVNGDLSEAVLKSVEPVDID